MSFPRLLIFGATLVSLGFAQTPPAGAAYRIMVDPSDAAFVTNALKTGHFQVDLARVASVRGGRERTKAFAELIIDEQSKINAALEALAKAKGIREPAREPMPVKLIGLKYKPFDHDYAILMVETCEKAVANYQKEAQSGIDPDLRKFAANAAPILLGHLELARRLKP